MELSMPVLIIIAIIVIAIILWLLLGSRGKRREEPDQSAAPARSVNLPSSADVVVPNDSAARIGTVNMPVVDVEKPMETPAPIPSFTRPTEEITNRSDVLETDVMTTDVASADAMRVEIFDHPVDQPLETAETDELEIIEGIGPKIRAVLNEAGVTRFAQLAAMEPVRITEILRAAGLRLADTTSWPEQARLAANGDMEGLKAMQDRLTAGRM